MGSSKRDLVIEGKFVRLEEVQPKHFPYIIEWRNNPENNKYLNHPFKLTMELQTKWYEEKYLKDDTQGLFVMVDKQTGTPFGTIGWTYHDRDKQICVPGRALVGDYNYRSSHAMVEGFLIAQDYMYEGMGVLCHYIHVVNENRQAISFNKGWGYIVNDGEVLFPQELVVSGKIQTEYVRTLEQYLVVRKKFSKLLRISEKY